MQSAAQAALANRLLIMLPKSAPDVNPDAVVAAGAADLKEFGSSIDGIRVAYMDGLKVSFAFACGSMGAALICSVFMRWKRIEGVVGGAA